MTARAETRILQVVQALPSTTLGGSELCTKRIPEALADREHDVSIASPQGDGSEIEASISVHRLPATSLTRPGAAHDGCPEGSPLEPRRT